VAIHTQPSRKENPAVGRGLVAGHAPSAEGGRRAAFNAGLRRQCGGATRLRHRAPRAQHAGDLRQCCSKKCPGAWGAAGAVSWVVRRGRQRAMTMLKNSLLSNCTCAHG
jgi:hypothetical protein